MRRGATTGLSRPFPCPEVSWFDPDCIQINPGRILSVTWNATKGKADYAYEC
jgi:hypothetical protein